MDRLKPILTNLALPKALVDLAKRQQQILCENDNQKGDGKFKGKGYCKGKGNDLSTFVIPTLVIPPGGVVDTGHVLLHGVAEAGSGEESSGLKPVFSIGSGQ